MTFGAPAMLGLLALLPLVVLLHLRRRHEVTVGSLLVWRRIADELAPRTLRVRRLVSNTSLFLQLLAVTALVLALARPDVGAAGERPEHLVALLDRSVAMSFVDVPPDRFQVAKEELLEAAGSLPPGTLLSVVVVAGDADIATARKDADDGLAAVLEPLDASDVPADWTAAAEAAAALLRPGERSEFVAFTSTEGAAAAREAVERVVPGAVTSAFPIGREVPVNAGLADVTAVPRRTGEGRWTIQGRLVGIGLPLEPVRIEAHVQPLGTEGFLSWGVTQATPDRSGEAAFDLTLDVPEPSLLELRLPDGGDALPSDDRVVVPLVPDRAIQVLWVGPDHPTLERALLAIPNLALHRADALPADAERYDLVVLDGVDEATIPRTSTLWIGAAPGGVDAPRLDRPRPTGWRTDHPLVSGLEWSDLSVEEALDLPTLAGADVLLESDGSPLVQARTTGQGRQVVVAFDPRSSNWPAQLGFPAFLAGAVDWAVPDRALTERTSCGAGRICGLPRDAFTADWRLLGPDGEVVLEPWAFLPLEGDPYADGVWPGEVFDLQFRPDRAGLYRLEFGAAARTAYLPVRARPWAERVEDAGGEVPHWSSYAPAGIPATRWFLALALALVAFEAARAGFGSEGFLRDISSGLRSRRRRSWAITGALAASLAAIALAWQAAPWPTPVSDTAKARIAPVAAPDESAGAGDYDVTVRYGGWDAAPGATDEAHGVADVDRAIGLAVAELPARERTILHVEVPADDRIPEEDYVRLLRLMEERAVELETTPAPEEVPPDPSVARVIAPGAIRAGDTSELVVITRNDGPSSLRLEGELGGDVAFEAEVPPGRVRHDLELTAPDAPGSRTLELRLSDAAGEVVWSGTTGLEILSPVRTLLLSSHTRAAERLAELLELHGIEVDVDLPRRTPTNLERLSAYDLVILQDVAAAELHTAHQELLEEWVASRGGGLVLLGGEQSFGAGGYFLTPLEDLSPLSARIPDELPEAALVFVLDRSGSMQGSVGPVTRLDIAKQATVSAFELLAPESLVGIVAFDAEAETVASVLPLHERETLEAAVASVRAGGGTAIHPGLVHARELLEGVTSATRHVIVMTDGLSQPGDFPGVLGELREMGVTVSFVGIGSGADSSQLSRLAELGGGSFHVTADVRALPAIMAQEAMRLASDPVETSSLNVEWTEPRASFLRGIETEPPTLEGYVRTAPKPDASVHLQDPTGEVPLLASWRYGLGRVVAFASQPVGPWAQRWNADDSLQSLWPQVVRWTAGEVRRSGLTLHARPNGSRLDLQVDAADQENAPIPGLMVRVELLDGEEGGIVASRRLPETRPGQYRSSVWMAGDPREFRVRAVVEGDGSPPWRESAEQTVVMPSPLTAGPRAQRGGPTITGLAAALDAGAGRGGSASILPWTLRWLPSTGAWILFAISAFLLALALRYLPGLLARRPGRGTPSTGGGDSPRRRPRAPAGAYRSESSANTNTAGRPATERGTP